MKVEGREHSLICLRETLRNARQSGQERTENLLNRKDDARAARSQHRNVARELDRIADSLVRTDKDRLTDDRLSAEPNWRGQLRIACGEMRDSPARLAPLPTRFEISGQHLEQRKIPGGRSLTRFDDQSPFIFLHGLV